MTFQIRRAERKQARLRLGLCGPSGSGKTYSALKLAAGLVAGTDGKIVVIDTERRSASLYADITEYDVLDLAPPYSPERYREAIAQACDYVGRNGVVIIDQISHAWAGEGGLLEYVDALKTTARNGLSPWAHATPEQNRLVDSMLRAPCHIIATMRSKVEWVLEVVEGKNGTKSTKPRKVGMAPVQRDGIEYEFTTMLDIDAESHAAVSTKDRSRIFANRIVKLDETIGRELRAWLESGAPDDEPAAPNATPDGAQQPRHAESAPAPESGTGAGAAGGVNVQSRLADMELCFLELRTLPEVAQFYEKCMKTAREWRESLPADIYKGAVNRIVAAKDARKAAITKATAPTTQQPLIPTEKAA